MKEQEEQSTADGMRAAIFRGSHVSHLIRSLLDEARFRGFSGEDTYVLLAYHALQRLEDYHQSLTSFIQLSPMPILVKQCPHYCQDKKCHLFEGHEGNHEFPA